MAKSLEQVGVEAASIHGDKSQGQRERALADFKAGKVRALVATDIAARGIDIDAVSHVVQFELPNVPESYVHRIGRTARAGADGSAVAFCADDERNLLRDIQKVTRQTDPVLRPPQRPPAGRGHRGHAGGRPAPSAPTPAARAAARPAPAEAQPQPRRRRQPGHRHEGAPARATAEASKPAARPAFKGPRARQRRRRRAAQSSGRTGVWSNR